MCIVSANVVLLLCNYGTRACSFTRKPKTLILRSNRASNNGICTTVITGHLVFRVIPWDMYHCCKRAVVGLFKLFRETPLCKVRHLKTFIIVVWLLLVGFLCNVKIYRLPLRWDGRSSSFIHPSGYTCKWQRKKVVAVFSRNVRWCHKLSLKRVVWDSKTGGKSEDQPVVLVCVCV